MATTIPVLTRRALASTYLVFALGGVAMGQWYVDDRASTPAESHARGIGAVIRSQGAYNLETSEALENMTETARQEIRNREDWTNTYFQLREANREYRRAEESPRPTTEDIVRYAQMGKPERLSPGEIDAVSGTLSWPDVLMAPAFDEERKELDRLFTNWIEYGSVAFRQRQQIRDMTDAMLAKLGQGIAQLPPPEYIKARRFLQSLAYEAYLAAR